MPPREDSSGREPARFPHLAAVAALTLGALVLRLVGLDFALPHMVEQDGEIPNQVRHLRDGVDNAAIRRDFGTYPLLCAYLTAATSDTPPVYERSTDATLAQHLAASGRTTLDVRRTVAVCSVAIVPATFFLARNFLGPWWSVLAAALVSLSTLNQSLSQQCRPHAVAAVFVTLALVAALRVVRVGTTAAYALLGTAFALALGLGSVKPMQRVWEAMLEPKEGPAEAPAHPRGRRPADGRRRRRRSHARGAGRPRKPRRQRRRQKAGQEKNGEEGRDEKTRGEKTGQQESRG